MKILSGLPAFPAVGMPIVVIDPTLFLAWKIMKLAMHMCIYALPM